MPIDHGGEPPAQFVLSVERGSTDAVKYETFLRVQLPDSFDPKADGKRLLREIASAHREALNLARGGEPCSKP